MMISFITDASKKSLRMSLDTKSCRVNVVRTQEKMLELLDQRARKFFPGLEQDPQYGGILHDGGIWPYWLPGEIFVIAENETDSSSNELLDLMHAMAHLYTVAGKHPDSKVPSRDKLLQTLNSPPDWWSARSQVSLLDWVYDYGTAFLPTKLNGELDLDSNEDITNLVTLILLYEMAYGDRAEPAPNMADTLSDFWIRVPQDAHRYFLVREAAQALGGKDQLDGFLRNPRQRRWIGGWLGAQLPKQFPNLPGETCPYIPIIFKGELQKELKRAQQ